MADSKMQNLDYIAARCGVSKMTVSRALRNDSGVSDATREMVMHAAQEANYFPPGGRRNASDGASEAILHLVPE